MSGIAKDTFIDIISQLNSDGFNEGSASDTAKRRSPQESLFKRITKLHRLMGAVYIHENELAKLPTQKELLLEQHPILQLLYLTTLSDDPSKLPTTQAQRDELMQPEPLQKRDRRWLAGVLQLRP